MDYSEKVAVIGAGTSGLMAIKCLKEEGFDPVCFEKTSYFGGLWKYHEEDVENVPSAMWCTSLNNSKEVGAISDFPPDAEYPNYMKHDKVLDMFTKYGEKFRLFRHIQYNKEVTKVQRSSDYDKTGKWQVQVRDIVTKEIQDYIFAAVMVCIGHLSRPNIPMFRGMKTFRNETVHTHSIKRFEDFRDKTVCVVGTGSSALDAAVEISHVANQVYLSIRNHVWISTRHGPYGYPLDWHLFTWDHNVLHKIFPLGWSNKFIQEVFMNPRFSHDLFDIHPTRGIANRDPAVSDCISSRLMNGTVILKGDIERVTEEGVVFQNDDNKEVRIDSLVLGTGYHWEFPFLEDRDFIVDGNKVYLYKCVYPPQLKHPTLGIVGFIVPMGPGFPCVEMQCRWFVHVLAGKGKLPSGKSMFKFIDKEYDENVKRYGNSSRVSVHVDFMPYLESLASEFGVLPNMMKMLFTDYKLFIACATGPYVPYRFRLHGSHKWSGARKAILETGQRMRAPLQGKKAFKKEEPPKRWPIGKYALASLIVFIYYLLKNKLVTYQAAVVLNRLFLLLRQNSVKFMNSVKETDLYSKILSNF